jgi:hypothetical protein
MPMDTLRQLNLDGDLKIAKLKVAQLTMAGVNLNIQAQQGIVKTKQSICTLKPGIAPLFMEKFSLPPRPDLIAVTVLPLPLKLAVILA